MPDLTVNTRRRLTDLYVKGTVVTFDDDDEVGPIAVYVKKIAPLEQRLAMEKANAEKARILALKFGQKDSDQRLSFLSQADTNGLLVDRDTMIDFLSGVELHKRRLSHDAETREEPRWSDNNYLDGLLELWESEMEAKYAENPEDPDAKKIFDELKAFSDIVEKKVEADRKGFRREYATDSDETLREKVINVLIEQESDAVWMNEFRKQEIFYSTCDPENHRQRYFESRDEIEQCDIEVLRKLSIAIDELNVDTIEGKDSEGTQSS